jgi:hypothetical protein
MKTGNWLRTAQNRKLLRETIFGIFFISPHFSHVSPFHILLCVKPQRTWDNLSFHAMQYARLLETLSWRVGLMRFRENFTVMLQYRPPATLLPITTTPLLTLLYWHWPRPSIFPFVFSSVNKVIVSNMPRRAYHWSCRICLDQTVRNLIVSMSLSGDTISQTTEGFGCLDFRTGSDEVVEKTRPSSLAQESNCIAVSPSLEQTFVLLLHCQVISYPTIFTQ